MKKIILSVSALFLTGTSFALIQADTIYFSPTASEKWHSIEYLVKKTPLTQIKEERASGFGHWINPLRNFDRMLRSIPEGKNTPTKTIQWLKDYIDGKLEELNTTGKIAVYGKSKQAMGYFLRQALFYWGGTR